MHQEENAVKWFIRRVKCTRKKMQSSAFIRRVKCTRKKMKSSAFVKQFSIVTYCCNVVHFLPNPHKGHLIAHSWRRGMGVLCEFNFWLTHRGRVTHICVSKLTIIGSDNDLSPGRRQAIIWTNAGILLIPTLRTNFSEILGEIHSFSFSKMHLKKLPAKWRLFGLDLSELSSLPVTAVL